MNIITKYSSKLSKILMLSYAAFTATELIAQDNDIFHNREKPKLVVEIVVGGIRYDQMYRLKDNISEGGFKRLVKNGTTFINARSSYMHNSPECGAASIASGANPSGHGIVGKEWINFTTNEVVEALADPKHKGIGCNEDEGRFSPKSMTASTLADEIKKSNSNSKVFSIALDYSDAILHGGYAPDGCYWFDARYGFFVTSSYYRDSLPEWINTFNNEQRRWDYLNSIWHTEYEYANYEYQNATSIILNKKTSFVFDMLFKPKNREFKRLNETPMGNDYIKDFAISTITNDSLGVDNNTDLLVINFSAQRNIAKMYGTASTETEDAYYKLDKNIEEILNHLDKSVGEGNYLVVLSSSHGMSDNVTQTEGANQGKFNAMQFKVLISGFLNAQFGTGNWVTSYANRQIYLNRRLAYEKNILIEDIQDRIASFAFQFAGIANTVTSSTLLTNYYGKGVLEKMQNNFFPRHSGDVMINLLPGWIEIVDENDTTTKSNWGSPYEYDSHLPLIFFGKDIDTKLVHTPVDIIDIAPTVSELIGVTHPNATEGSAISEIISKN